MRWKRSRGAGAATGLVGVLLLAGAAAGQRPGRPEDAKAAPAAGDLSTRYRLREKPTLAAGKAPEGTVGQYRVAFREKITTIVDQPRSAPKRLELTFQGIYRERPAVINPLDDRKVDAAVRRYDGATIDPAPPAKPTQPRPFDGLLLWYEDRPGDWPQILSLSPDRSLIGREYLTVARQGFVPDLAFALPDLPLRAGDTYRVSPAGAEALAGGPVRDARLEGKLLQLRPDASAAGRMMAVLDITGGAVLSQGPAQLHAQIRFLGTPAAAATSTPRAPIMDMPGRVVKLSLAHEIDTGPPARPGTRGGEPPPSRMQLRREFVLERDAEQPGPELTIPNPRPAATPANSWLTYENPGGQFHFRHPQELQPAGDEEDAVTLIHMRREGPEVVSLELRPRAELEPDKVREGQLADLKEAGFEVVPGAAGPLPEADWPGLKPYRFEAALLNNAAPGAGPRRVHYDGYILLSGRDEGLFVEATTPQDPAVPFRDQVEAMLKTFRFGEAGAGERPGGPAPARGAGR